jgi:hypothetical protein
MAVERIQLRRGTTEQWSTTNPVLAFGEVGVEITTAAKVKFKIGDNVKTWSQLPYFESVADINLSNYATDQELEDAIADLIDDYLPDTYLPISQKGNANGLASLDSNAKIPSSQLPALSITNTSVVASQAAMLALEAETGDVAVRTDLNKSFILTASPATTLSNWQELLSPPDTVTSVNTKTGNVTLKLDDIDDVAVQPGVATGHYLKYDAGTQTWQSSAFPTVDTSGFATLANAQTFTGVKTFGPGSGIVMSSSAMSFTNATFTLPLSAAPAQTVEGQVVWNSTNDLLTVGTGSATKTMVDTNSTQTLTNKTLTVPRIDALTEKITINETAVGVSGYPISEIPIMYFNQNSPDSNAVTYQMNYSSASSSFSDSVFPVGRTITHTVIYNHVGSANARYINTVTFPGITTLTTRWLGGSPPTNGNPGSLDVYNFSFWKTGSTSGIVLASLTRF